MINALVATIAPSAKPLEKAFAHHHIRKPSNSSPAF